MSNYRKSLYFGLTYDQEFTPPKAFKRSRSRIMYVESKFDSNDLEGDARIGRVYFSKTGKTLYYRGVTFQSLKGVGFKVNFFDVATNNHYWISGPRKDQNDRLYGGNAGVVIDEDVYDEYLKYIQN